MGLNNNTVLSPIHGHSKRRTRLISERFYSWWIMTSLEIRIQRIFNDLIKQNQKLGSDSVLRQSTTVSSVQNVAPSVQIPASRVQRPGSSVRSPASRVQSQTSRVQRSVSSVQCPRSNVQCPGSSVQDPASRA